MLHHGSDREVRAVEVVGVRERESVFERACPVLPLPLAVFCLGNNVHMTSAVAGGTQIARY